MADSMDRDRLVEALRASLLENERLRERDHRRDGEPDEPVAIIGMSCRFPGGADTPEALWQLVTGQVDAITPFPADRGWDVAAGYHQDPDHTGTTYTRHGGFLEEPGGFDADFFGVSPREALTMDPQQRLLLETAWEAVERAGIAPTDLRGSRTGVYAGVLAQDYAGRLRDPAGSMGSVASGRVAYTLGLQGPAITLDTACSSSLVALHLACQALRGGECGLALAGGVTVMPTMTPFIQFSRQRGLAPDGRCKPFAAGADGTGWAEGAGVLLLERLVDARHHGHPVLAIVRGSSVNQDGTSSRLSAPNGSAQQAVIRAALRRAGLTPDQIDAVEAHGTGTVLGDPIEAEALRAVHGDHHGADRPLWLGSVKSNIGHTQAAAGLAGVIKTVQALRYGVLPATLHIDEPTPHVDWEAGGLALLTAPRPWGEPGRPRRAGVSSFGISGTNAHVILEQAPDEPPDTASAAGGSPAPVPVVLSGRTAAAVREQARRLTRHLRAHPDLPVADVARTLATGRTRFAHRAAVTAGTREELLRSLAAVVPHGPARATPGGTVFVLPGQGAQWAGMGAELLDTCEVFAARLQECADALAPFTAGWSVPDVLRQVPGAPSFERTDVVQPVLFAVTVSLAALWEWVGGRPDAVVGHSQGEIAAAYLAGAFDLADAAALVALRARALETLTEAEGGMLTVARPAAWAADRLAAHAGLVVAAVNGPNSCVVAGDRKPLTVFARQCEAAGVRTRPVPIAYASHSPQVEAVRAALLEGLADIVPRASDIAFYSALTGTVLPTERLDARYWYDSLRGTVQFERATRALLDDGHRVFVEPGPHPALTPALQDTLDDSPHEGLLLPTLHRGEGGLGTFLASVCAAHTQGVDIAWPAALFGPDARVADLPTYPFERQRYWLADTEGSTVGEPAVRHPFLDSAVRRPDGALVVTGRVRLADHPWLAGHTVGGTAVLPGTALLELVLYAGRLVGHERLAELALVAPLPLPAGSAVPLEVTIGAPDADGHRGVSVHSGSATGVDTARTCHATGSFGPPGADPVPPEAPYEDWPPPGAEPLSTDGLYERLAERGYGYGPAFQGLRRAWRRGHTLYAEVGPPPSPDASSTTGPFASHPALLDAALHPYVAYGMPDEGPRAPFVWRDVSLRPSDARVLRVRIDPGGTGEASVAATDPTGASVLRVGELSTRPFTPVPQLSGEGGLFRLRWAPRTAPAEVAEASSWCVLGSAALAQTLSEAKGAPVPVCDDLGAVPQEATVVFAPTGGAGESAEAAREVLTRCLTLLQEWLADERFEDARLVLITRRAVATGPGIGVVDPSGAAVWGLVRSAQKEHPGRFLLLDLDETDDSARAVSAALSLTEAQIAVRDGIPLAPDLDAAPHDLMPEPDDDTVPWRLEITERGRPDGYGLVPCPELQRPLHPGEVRIQLHAAGLNFRDVVVALDMIHDTRPPSGEGTGTITETAPDVTTYQPGDHVTGLLTHGIAPTTITHHNLITHTPTHWTPTQAATLPIAFLTAHHALTHLTHLQPHQPLLIHNATGGVGQAALQIAQHHHATIYTTAHPTKWHHLTTQGIPPTHIANSRTLDYTNQYKNHHITTILHALTGPHTHANLHLLTHPNSHLIDIGKTNPPTPTTLHQHPHITYHHFDLEDAGPELLQRELAELRGLCEEGVLRPLPTTVWDIRRAPEALRHLSQSRHIGKVVLTLPRRINPHGTILITGGTGTLGRLVARHLVLNHDARHLLLLNRSGQPPTLPPELADLDADITITACDITDPHALDTALRNIPAAHPLTAVIHTAATLNDATLTHTTTNQLQETLHAKAQGAWNLHQATLQRDLTAFVLFSSLAGTLGSPGQAAYAAANAYLDALAHHRRHQGLPATSIAWGHWEQASGMTEHLTTTDQRRMASAGVLPLSTEGGLALFDAALADGAPHLVAARLNTAAVRAVPDSGSSLTRPTVTPSGPLGKRELLRVVREHTAGVLGHADAGRVDPERPFQEFGFDSLTSVELRNRLLAATGVRLPTTAVFDHPTPMALADHLHGRLGGDTAAPLLAELDRLESALPLLEEGDVTQELIAERLTSLLSKLGSRPKSPKSRAGRREAGALPDLDTATDEELFAEIDDGKV